MQESSFFGWSQVSPAMEQGWRFLSWVNEWANSSLNTFVNSRNMWWAPSMCQVCASMSHYVLGGGFRGDKAEFLPHWKQNVQWTLWTSWGFPEGFLLSFLPSFPLSFLRWQAQSSEKCREMAIILPHLCLCSFQPKMKESGNLVLILSSSEMQSHLFQVTQHISRAAEKVKGWISHSQCWSTPAVYMALSLQTLM